MKKVKYAIIGFGGIAENRIAKEGFGLDKERFKGHPTAELVSVTDINPEREKAAKNLGVKWRRNLDDILNDADIDAVFIATNNLTHAPIAERALLAAKHCIIDKPIATTLRDAEKIIGLAQQNKLSIAVDHMMMENVYNIKAKELIADKALGDVNDICLHMEFYYGSTAEEAAAWRCANPKELGGPIGDVASHCFYMAEFLLNGKIESLACVYTPITLNINVENGAFIQFKLRDQVWGTIRVAFNQQRGGLGSTLSNLGYEVYGTKGMLKGYATLFQFSGHEDEPVNVRLELDKFDKTEIIKISDVKNIYQAVINRHALSILNNAPLNALDAIHNLNLAIKSHQSAQNKGEFIKL